MLKKERQIKHLKAYIHKVQLRDQKLQFEEKKDEMQIK